MTEIATLSERGQIVIPQNVREKLHLEAGSKFIVYPLNDSVILRKLDIPSLDKWDEVLKPIREAARKKKITEKDIERAIQELRRQK